MTQTRKCLVTGATGFVGTNLVHELVKAGWDVRASGMHGSETRYIKHLPIELVMADITQADEVDPLVAGCDVVFHVAGDTSYWKRNYPRQRKINVDGALLVAQACLRHGVERMVHTSTLDVLGYCPDGGDFNEETGQFNFTNMGYHYGETKYEAEQKLRQLHIEQGLDVVFIYPGFMVGPFDYTLQLGKLFFELLEGKVPGYIPGGGSFCHVTEVAKAHIAAADKGLTGEGYLCAGLPHSNITHKAMWQKMAMAVGAKPLLFTIPRWAFLAYAYGCEFVAEFSRKPPQINPGQARYMLVEQYALSNKAVEVLGYQVPTVDECIEDAVSWYRANGFLPD